MEKAVIYCRSPSIEQIGKPSVFEQLKRLRQYAKENNYKVIKEFVDGGASGKDLIRSSLGRLLRKMEEGKFKILITQDQTRLSTNVIDWVVLKDLFRKHSVEVKFFKPPKLNSAAENFAEMTLAFLEQYQKRIRSERAKKVIQRSKQKQKTPRLEAKRSLAEKTNQAS